MTINTFLNNQDAHMAKLLLEKEGIEVFLLHEGINTVLNFHNVALGGTQLQVHPDNAALAKVVLRDAGYLSSASQKKELNYKKLLFYGLLLALLIAAMVYQMD
jgi:predicted naringenin-chalcone synthase